MSILTFVFLLLLSNTLFTRKKTDVLNISVIVRGENSESWNIMKEGMEQAASEMKVNLNFLTLSKENSVEEQKKLIDREISGKVDGILISPVDSKAMTEKLEAASGVMPIVMVESAIDTKKNLQYISCDNYSLGTSLAEEVIKNEGKTDIVLVKNNLQISSIYERYTGFIDAIMETDLNLNFWEISKGKSNLSEEIKNLIENSKGKVIVTFDTSILENIGKIKKELQEESGVIYPVSLYGTGTSNKVISYLEEGIVRATAVQNDFNVGYLGVKTVVDSINGKEIEKTTIHSTVVNSENMYSKENQPLLFPLVK